MVARGSERDLEENIGGEVSREESEAEQIEVKIVKLGRTIDKDGGDYGSENQTAARIAGN